VAYRRGFAGLFAALVLAHVCVVGSGCQPGCQVEPPPDYAASAASLAAVGAQVEGGASEGRDAGEVGEGSVARPAAQVVTVSRVVRCDDCLWFVFATQSNPSVNSELSLDLSTIGLRLEYRFDEVSPWKELQREAVESNRPLIPVIQSAPSIARLPVRTDPGRVTEVLFDGVLPRGARDAERVYLRLRDKDYYFRDQFEVIVPEWVPIVRCE
jgi:hypothetical protein